jgi:valyl-tRNA synthetase
MSEIPKAYEPQAVEAKWLTFWQENSCFTADPARVSEDRPAYSIVIPPPNVTGVLTLGHVLNNTVQDILARKARMDGKEVLWLPGCDHAGIATQTVVERTLKKSGEIRHRNDLGRERFLEKVWGWKEKHGGIINEQLRRLGASCDWTRERFTMDPAYSACVQKVFVELFRQGLIYRGRRMVNWCPVSLTALSDEEVIPKAQKGLMYRFRVEVDGEPGTFLTIATTRPETIPADTAVAVNPKDPRYAHLIGRKAVRPLPPEQPRGERLIPIIGDESVDFAFGTGVLKVTPAHDKTDFEIGQRHKLPILEVLNADGTLNEFAGERLRGMDRFKGRAAASELLKELGALEKEEPYQNNVGYSERADVPVEPRLSDQWFLKYPQTEAARAVVADGRMRFFPERWAKVYDHWMGNLQDWCISRQLWWGHRIPVWAIRMDGGSAPAGFPSADDAMAATRTMEMAGGTVHVRARRLPDGRIEWLAATESVEAAKALELAGLVQDSDVLDTWFSSWLWPFATMGWPERTPTLAVFYPTTDLVTGPDIIFFWVARMIIAGYEFMRGPEFGLRDPLPFRNVYFTGIIRDKQGRKMSKSLGNSPDPLELIAKYGADALRFGVMRAAPLGQDVLFDEQAVELGRNFCNKLWNACRFRQMQSGGSPEAEINPALLSLDDRWILRRLDQAVIEVSDALAGYRFSEAAAALYRFFWSEYCDWYVEAVKPVLSGGRFEAAANTLAVIDFVLATVLRLFHPFLPYITEELWSGLGFNGDLPSHRGGSTIGSAVWPKAFSAAEIEHFGLDDSVDAVVGARNELISGGRNLKSQFNLGSNPEVRFVFRPASADTSHDTAVMRALLGAGALDTAEAAWAAPKGTPKFVNAYGELHLPLAGLVDFAAERARKEKELEKVRAEVKKVEDKLANPSFTQKAPPQVLDEHRQRLADWRGKEAQLVAELGDMPE